VWFHGVVEINETDKFFLAMFAIPELDSVVPHFHECPNHSLCFSVRLRAFHSRESLRDFVFRASFDEVVRLSATIFCAVVGVGCLD